MYNFVFKSIERTLGRFGQLGLCVKYKVDGKKSSHLIYTFSLLIRFWFRPGLALLVPSVLPVVLIKVIALTEHCTAALSKPTYVYEP